ncbi:esterase-like activity of phytase family protein [Acuticoccus mangrovi]|uniref:Esterase-like activity of phytase family protein n=1 Tax=Acuticoccus mangrovi TaxID=2796142 RepID=A0A934MGP1_9HYPH|nr:esterase-like activity of phytase family protein [Acuticoccus mangrovi]MBJ3775196.1 esterase-like activity of phytase family protein [Acuticoccus mangrovi]
MTIKHLAVTTMIVAGAAIPAHADTFNRIASFSVADNLPKGMDPATESSSEIIDATDDGMTLVYSDSPLGAVGIVDISDPAAPKAGGAIMMDGEPTSLVISGGTAYVAVNTSASYTEPSGVLKLVDIAAKTVTESCDLGGQPDSAAIAADGSFLAIAIENERDEDLNDGALPQLPAGTVAIIPLTDGAPDCDAAIFPDLTGLAEEGADDPEPEFVDINADGAIAVTLQENNHIVILSPAGEVLSHFSAGSVRLTGADTEEEGALTFAGTVEAPREPDAVKWLDTEHLIVANEGDYKGGTRGFTVFDRDGGVVYEAGLAFEYAVAAAGHYPEKRSGNKGVEPEGLAFGTFAGTPYAFVLAERASVVGVYDMTDPSAPVLKGLLPSGIAPEGAVAIPSRNLLVTANEADLGPDGGARSHVMIYRLEDAAPTYPTIVSVSEGETPLGWGALSGLSADPADPTKLYAINDSFFKSQPTIFVVDVSSTPATIVDAIPVTRDGMPAQKLDLEGIVAVDGGFWLASEGRSDRLVPHALYRTNMKGEIKEEVPFPAELLAGERRFGAEGVTKIGDTLWVAIQREWGDDPKGSVKLLAYDTKAKTWGAVRYPLETPEKGWMGLSEITAVGDSVYIVERDNQIGAAAKVKRLYSVPAAELKPAALGGDLPTVSKTLVHDFIPDLAAYNGYVVDKVEGFAVAGDGTAYVVTDNDGVDDSSGETFFFPIGKLGK